MDIFEGRLQSELIGEGWGALSASLTFCNGPQRNDLQPNASCNEWFGHFLSKRKGSSSFFLFVPLREVTAFPLLLATSDYRVGSLQKSPFVVRTLIFSPGAEMRGKEEGWKWDGGLISNASRSQPKSIIYRPLPNTCFSLC